MLKRALIEEQNKSSCLRETLRIRETSLRRVEQEVDSLGFRNKQLEHRVATLQEDFERESKGKSNKNVKLNKTKNNNDTVAVAAGLSGVNDPIFSEELHKKIFENAELVSLVEDKNSAIDLLSNRLRDLEYQLHRKNGDHADVEMKLRKDIECLMSKNAALEARLIEGTSILGSDDTLSVSESDHTPIHQNCLATTSSQDEKVARLEKELFHLKTRCEYSKICDISSEEAIAINKLNNKDLMNGQTCTDGGMADDTVQSILTKEQLIYNHFTKEMEHHFTDKTIAESKVITFMAEVCFYYFL